MKESARSQTKREITEGKIRKHKRDRRKTEREARQEDGYVL